MKPKTLIPALTSEYLTKNSLFIYSDAITNTETPLRTYIAVKGLETVCKKILSDKQFRELVKENFLYISGGSIDKHELFGVTVSTVLQIKKNELAKDYIYSDAVQSLQKEIDLMKLQLKSKEDLLKGMKLQEINSGEAQEVLSGFVEVAEADPLKDFDLKITFK